MRAFLSLSIGTFLLTSSPIFGDSTPIPPWAKLSNEKKEETACQDSSKKKDKKKKQAEETSALGQKRFANLGYLSEKPANKKKENSTANLDQEKSKHKPSAEDQKRFANLGYLPEENSSKKCEKKKQAEETSSYADMNQEKSKHNPSPEEQKNFANLGYSEKPTNKKTDSSYSNLDQEKSKHKPSTEEQKRFANLGYLPEETSSKKCEKKKQVEETSSYADINHEKAKRKSSAEEQKNFANLGYSEKPTNKKTDSSYSNLDQEKSKHKPSSDEQKRFANLGYLPEENSNKKCEKKKQAEETSSYADMNQEKSKHKSSPEEQKNFANLGYSEKPTNKKTDSSYSNLDQEKSKHKPSSDEQKRFANLGYPSEENSNKKCEKKKQVEETSNFAKLDHEKSKQNARMSKSEERSCISENTPPKSGELPAFAKPVNVSTNHSSTPQKDLEDDLYVEETPPKPLPAFAKPINEPYSKKPKPEEAACSSENTLPKPEELPAFAKPVNVITNHSSALQKDIDAPYIEEAPSKPLPAFARPVNENVQTNVAPKCNSTEELSDLDEDLPEEKPAPKLPPAFARPINEEAKAKDVSEQNSATFVDPPKEIPPFAKPVNAQKKSTHEVSDSTQRPSQYEGDSYQKKRLSERLTKAERWMDQINQSILSPKARKGFVVLDFLCWKGKPNETNFAFVSDLSPGATTPNLVGKTVRGEVDWKPGSRLEVGFAMPYEWNVGAIWTYYHNESSFSKSSSSDFIPLWVSNNFATEGTYAYHLNYNTVDVQFDTHWYLSKNLIFKPFFDARAAWIHSSDRMHYAKIPPNITGVPTDTTVVIKDGWWGIGPRVGGETSFKFGKTGLSFLGDLSGALLYGNAHAKRVIHQNVSITDSTSQTDPGQFLNWRENYGDLRASLELMIGANYEWRFDGDKKALHLHALWEANYWWNQLVSFVVLGGESSGPSLPLAKVGKASRALLLYGFNLGLGFDY